MEFSLREWLILVGIIVIVGVMLDGYRRVRSGLRGRLKMSIDKSQKLPGNDKMDYFNGELPNGGARAVNRSADDISVDADETEQQAPIPAFDVDPELRPDPLFADDPEPQIFADPDVAVADNVVVTEAVSQAAPESTTQTESAATTQGNPAPQAAAPNTPEQPANAVAAQEKPASYQDVEEVIVMNVFAKDDNGFNGADLMRVILACGMRYGDLNIFHRTEEGADGTVQFSMANVVKPGTFELDNMNNFYTPGVSFFLSLPGPKNSLKALEYMHETAQCVVKNLNGELKDEMHSAMTGQTIEHSRQKVRDYERRQLSLLR